MKIIPAVDIKNGKCVRLVQGRADQETVYGEDPVEMACHWDEEGAQLIHVVDLDGAFEGSPKNASIIKNIIYSSSVDIQVGGGIRNMESIDAYFSAGAYRIILGTIALQDPALVEEASKRYPGKILIGLDAKAGQVAVKGWVEVSDRSVTDVAQQMEPLGVAGFVYTDIGRDGMMQGPNIESTRAFAESTSLPVIASGGVSRLEDVTSIMSLKESGVDSMIIGKALYDQSFKLKEALEIARGHAG